MLRLPEYLKTGLLDTGDPKTKEIRAILKEYKLNTVCDSARCPNKKECHSKGSATFMIMGNICTRNCKFCNVTKNTPLPLDKNEPKNIAKAIQRLGLEYCVITSVTRDDLEDFGSGHFGEVIREIRKTNPNTKTEVLVPDFKGDKEALKTVLDAQPDVFNHNIETVKSLYKKVREMANYAKSLEVLRFAKEYSPKTITKTGLMVGLGESREELFECFEDIKKAGCDILTIGQYIRPSKAHLEVARYCTPDEFREFGEMAAQKGIPSCVSAPLARSSYMASESFREASFRALKVL